MPIDSIGVEYSAEVVDSEKNRAELQKFLLRARPFLNNLDSVNIRSKGGTAQFKFGAREFSFEIEEKTVSVYGLLFNIRSGLFFYNGNEIYRIRTDAIDKEKAVAFLEMRNHALSLHPCPTVLFEFLQWQSKQQRQLGIPEGWTTKKMAEHYGCTDQNIRKHIEKFNSKNSNRRIEKSGKDYFLSLEEFTNFNKHMMHPLNRRNRKADS